MAKTYTEAEVRKLFHEFAISEIDKSKEAAISIADEFLEQYGDAEVTGKQVADALFPIHKHDEEGKIFYYEDELLEKLNELGLPIPVWE